MNQTKHVLIVEDESKLAHLMAEYLQKDGYTCDVVHDGNSAVETAKSRQPDLVLLDLMLPHKDGMQVCREIRLDPRLRY